MGIRRKMAVGAVWKFIEKGGQQLSSFIVFAVIARLIGPEEYGLVTLCYFFLSLASGTIISLVDPVISLKIKDEEKLSTIFWSVIGVGLFISLLTFALSGPYSNFINAPKMQPLLQVFAILPVMMSLSSVPSALITASMNFRIYTIRTFVATVLGGGIGIYMALKGYGGYALIGQQIIFYAVTNVAVWVGSGWYPKLCYNRKNIIDCAKLGLNQTGSSYVSIIENQVPRILLGIMVGPYAVGQWAFVARIRGAVQDCLLQPIISVIYPAFSSIQDDLNEQRKILNNLVRLFGFMVFPMIALAIVLASQYVPLFFGNVWVDTVPLLHFYLISSATMAFTTVTCDLMRAHKQIGAYFRVQLLLVSIWVLATVFLVRWGLQPLLIGEVIMGFIGLSVYLHLLATKTGLNLIENFKLLWPALLASLCAAAATLWLKQTNIMTENALLSLVTNFAFGCCVYMITYCALERKRIGMLIEFIRSRRVNKSITAGE